MIVDFMEEQKKKQLDPAHVAMGRAVQARRLARGMTVAELGDVVGVSEAQMWRLEAGESGFTRKRLRVTARALGTVAEVLEVEAGLADPDWVELLQRMSAMTREERRAWLELLRSQDKNSA